MKTKKQNKKNSAKRTKLRSMKLNEMSNFVVFVVAFLLENPSNVLNDLSDGFSYITVQLYFNSSEVIHTKYPGRSAINTHQD